MTTVSEQGLSPATILVVDDDESVRRLVKVWLEAVGYRVREAGDGDAAVEAARLEHPDLILMDMNLMMTNGLVAANLIRGIHGLGAIPIVAMSGFASTELRQAALSAGCDEFVPKPIRFSALVKLINRLLGKEEDH